MDRSNDSSRWNAVVRITIIDSLLAGKQDNNLNDDCIRQNWKRSHHRLPQSNSLRTSPNRIASILYVHSSDILSIRSKQRCSDSEIGVRAYNAISEDQETRKRFMIITISTGFGVYGFLAEFLELVEGDGEAGGVCGDLGGDGTHGWAGATVDGYGVSILNAT